MAILCAVGSTDQTRYTSPDSAANARPDLEGLQWDTHEGTRVLLPSYLATMAINADFDLSANPSPAAPTKFSPVGPSHPHVLLGTAEEWVLYNNSLTLWAHTDTERFPQPGRYGLHYRSFPLVRADGQARFARDSEFQITSKGGDHPFHIHINPIWVTRIDVPDENGELHNLLDAPRWMDTVPIPRNGGRVVFRTRFLDFTGRWVNHCHILMHEDHGMMQIVECGERAADADYRARDSVADHAMPASAVDRIYLRPSIEIMYRQNMSFEEESPAARQQYPGFDLSLPVLQD